MSDDRTRPASGGVRLTRPPWRPRAAVGLVAVAMALIAGWWAADTLWLTRPLPADAAGHEALVDARTPAMIAVAMAFTRLGDLWVVAMIGTVLAAIARWRAGRWDPAILAVTVVVGALAVTNIVKVLTDRTRPEGALVNEATLAFPSGHASRAAAVCALAGWIAWRLARSEVLRLCAVVGAAAIAVAIGWSRLVLGVHWPTDVFAGWLLGGVWTITTLRITRPRAGPGPAETEFAGDR